MKTNTYNSMKKWILSFVLVALSAVGFTQNTTVLDVNVSDMAYDESRNKLFALIGSTDSLYGNNLIQINCNSKKVEKSLFVGSNPELIALTYDHNHAYIALAGSPKIVKVDLATFSIEMEFPIGPIGSSVNVYAEDMVTIPGRPNLLAVARTESNYVRDVVIFNNGVLTPDSVSRYDIAPTSLACDSTGYLLLGYNGANSGHDFGRIYVADTGVSMVDKYSGVLSGFNVKIYFVNGLIYSNTGAVVNVYTSIPFIEGTFSNVGFNSQLAINTSLKESYFGSIDDNTSVTVRRYNLENYTLKSQTEIPLNLPPTVTIARLREFICYGDNKFVLSAYEQYFAEDNENYIIFLDGVDSTDQSGTSVGNEVELNDFKVFPNPAHEILTIIPDFQDEYSIKLLNINGQSCYTQQSAENELKINVSGFDAGIYFVKVSTNQRASVQKIAIH